MTSRETFNEMVWRFVEKFKDQTLVVDNDHAYAIIRRKLDDWWLHVRSIAPDDDQIQVLGGLVAIAGMAQLSAEGLRLADEQAGIDETRKNLEGDRQKVWDVLESVVLSIGKSSEPTERLQRDTPRFKFEFGEDWFEALQEQVQSLK